MGQVFDHAFVSFVGDQVTSSDQKLIPRTGEKMGEIDHRTWDMCIYI
jgi:hypothetical protein